MAPKTIDEYIAAFPPEVQAILRKIRATIKKAAPDAEEGISYQMPSFTLNGPLVYFGAFKNLRVPSSRLLVEFAPRLFQAQL